MYNGGNMNIIVDEIKVGDEAVNQYGEEGGVTAMNQGEITEVVIKKIYRDNNFLSWTKRAVRGSD